MASTNQSPFYQRAEADFLNASSDEERLECLEIMIKECPKHKSSENMLRNLTTRYKKIKTGLEKQRRSGKTKMKGIKKGDMQLIISGFPNVGKSSLFKLLTKQNTKISPTPYTTYQSKLGTTKFEDVKIQTIDLAPFPNEDKSLINSADVILLVVDNIKQIKDSEKYLKKIKGKLFIIYNKEDLLNETEKRKLTATINTKYKKLKTYLLSTEKPNNELLKDLLKEIYNSFPIIRVYTKEPRKKPTEKPMILKRDSTIESAAEKILKGMSKNLKRARIWGPSSKFGGQTVGIEHKLKDKDIIEFQTK